MDTVLLRPAEASDRSAALDVVRAAFPGDGRVPELVDAVLATGSGVVAVVAEVEAVVVGYAMCSPALLDSPDRLVDVLTLSPLAVRPERQGAGIGRALVARALEAARSAGSPLVFLEGDPAYYVRSGFRRADALGFRSPSLRIPPAAFQVAVLPAYEPWMTGTFVYPDVFWRLDCVGLRTTGTG